MCNLQEQAEFNCMPSHLGTFCPPLCSKCNPCVSKLCDCQQECIESCPKRYEKVRYVQSCNIKSTKSNCPPCDLIPPRRESFKPIYMCKTQTIPMQYETIYRNSFDVPTYNPPPY